MNDLIMNSYESVENEKMSFNPKVTRINISEPTHMPINYFFDTIRKKIILQPEFQRKFVWPVSRQKELIKSLYNGIPIQMFYFAKKSTGELEVIDGQQRLTTIFGFLDKNKVPRGVRNKLVKKIKIIDENGKEISKEDLKKVIKDTHIYFVEIKEEDLSLSKKYEIFQTLNKGAMPLKAQEIRNCLFEGEKMSYLNKSLRRGAEALEKFLSVNFKRMEGEEYVLRFFIINSRQNYGDKKVTNILDDINFIKNELTEEKVRKLSREFKDFLDKLKKLFSTKKIPFKNYFQLLKDDVGQPQKLSDLNKYIYTGKLNQGLFHLFSYYLPKFKNNQFNRINIRKFQKGYIELLKNEKFILNVSGSATDSPKKMKKSKKEFEEFVNKYLGDPFVSPRRNITKQERMALYKNIPYCYLCYEKFKNFKDAVAEHIEPFDKGGECEFRNILLSCIKCNLEKGNRNLIEYRERKSSIKRRIKNINNIKEYLKSLEEWHKVHPLDQYRILRRIAKYDLKKLAT